MICRSWGYAAVVLIVGITLGCKPIPQPTAAGLEDTPFVSPLVSPVFESPVRATPGDRGLSALESYQAARSAARKWNPQGMWYGIVPTAIMESNLGIPSMGRGWFFQFGLGDSTVEYYVFVDHGEVGGSTEAQPILIEPLPYEYLPLDVEQIKVDSPQVLRIYRANGGEAKLQGNVQLDYRLVHVKGTPNPVWSLFDVSDLNNALIHVDARTGQVTDDPFAQR